MNWILDPVCAAVIFAARPVAHYVPGTVRAILATFECSAGTLALAVANETFVAGGYTARFLAIQTGKRKE
jgi:hypothetical protein